MEVIKRKVDDRDYIVGYTCMMAPSHPREQGKVFKMFQVHIEDSKQMGDLHFFEFVADKWIWIRDYSYINLNGSTSLLDTYDNIPHGEMVEFETFERLVFYALYL